jgi:hypothetical protein
MRQSGRLLKNSSLATYVIALVLMAASQQIFANSPKEVPAMGMTQEQVKSIFGEPKAAKPPVGKPPISRWDYEDYSVYFESNTVIHAFMHRKRITPALNPAPEPAKIKTVPAPTLEQQAEEAVTEEVIEEQMEEQKAAIEKAEQEVQQDMENVEQAVAEEKAVEAEVAEVEEVKETDLNFEEKPQETDFGKWGY